MIPILIVLFFLVTSQWPVDGQTTTSSSSLPPDSATAAPSPSSVDSGPDSSVKLCPATFSTSYPKRGVLGLHRAMFDPHPPTYPLDEDLEAALEGVCTPGIMAMLRQEGTCCNQAAVEDIRKIQAHMEHWKFSRCQACVHFMNSLMCGGICLPWASQIYQVLDTRPGPRSSNASRDFSGSEFIERSQIYLVDKDHWDDHGQDCAQAHDGVVYEAFLSYMDCNEEEAASFTSSMLECSGRRDALPWRVEIDWSPPGTTRQTDIKVLTDIHSSAGSNVTFVPWGPSAAWPHYDPVHCDDPDIQGPGKGTCSCEDCKRPKCTPRIQKTSPFKLKSQKGISYDDDYENDSEGEADSY